jgi:hypothetical protein
MRHYHVRWFVLFVLIAIATCTVAAARGVEDPPTTGPRPGYMILRLRSFPSGISSHWEERVQGSSYGSLAETNSDFGDSYGAGAEFCLNRVFLRGSYQEGRYTFADHGQANYSTVGIDVGLRTAEYQAVHSIVALGVRRIVATRSYEEMFANDNHALRFQELFVEFIMKSKPDKAGLVVGAEADFSIQGIPNIIRSEGKYEHMGVTLFLDIGSRLRALPLSATVGGELQVYQFEYDMIPDPGPSFADILGRARIDATYGLTFRLSYAFGPW